MAMFITEVNIPSTHQSTESVNGYNGSGSTSSPSISNSSNNGGHSSKYLQYTVPLEKQGCIPFLGLFMYDLTHTTVLPPWYLPPLLLSDQKEGKEEECVTPLDKMEHNSTDGSIIGAQHSKESTSPMSISDQLRAPSSAELQELLPTGKLLVNFYRLQLIAKTIKWFLAFQKRPQKYTFSLDSTLYSKCLLLRVLNEDRLRELADSCEGEYKMNNSPE
ncbi:hypothetical protein BX616_000896 [Lobosporangium transversale]|nr:hypothetical protein BX616_000896 [Lobosporangium transversale]